MVPIDVWVICLHVAAEPGPDSSVEVSGIYLHGQVLLYLPALWDQWLFDCALCWTMEEFGAGKALSRARQEAIWSCLQCA